MKRSLWNITLAAVVTMVVYIALSAVWGAILNELENVTLQLFLLSLIPLFVVPKITSLID